MKTVNIELIKWVDSFGCPMGWKYADDTEFAFTTVSSVGFVEKETDEMVVLIPHMSNAEEKQIMGYVSIPRCQIIERRVISSVEHPFQPD